MKCEQTRDYLEDYCDKLLSKELTLLIEHHLQHCTSCTHAIESHQQYLKKLQSCKPYTANDNRKLIAFVSTKKRRQRQAFGAAVIAAMLLLITIPFTEQSRAPFTAPTHDTNNIHMINVIIRTPKSMKNAALTLALPDGTRLEGYEGSEQLTWYVDLKSGQNQLTLPIRTTNDNKRIVNIEIIIRYKNKTKSFQLTADDIYLNDSSQGSIYFTTPVSNGA